MINITNLLILLGLMIPNIIYALSVKDIKHVKKEKEQKTDAEVNNSTPEKTALEELLYAEDTEAEQEQPEELQTELQEELQAELQEELQEKDLKKSAKKEKRNNVSDAKKKARWKRLDFWIGIAEAVGRGASMILMIVPFGVLEFEFSNSENSTIYTFGNIILMLTYWIMWSRFLKKRTFKRAISLSILSTLIFLLTGLTLDHWWLALSALVYGVCHTGMVLESVWEEEAK